MNEKIQMSHTQLGDHNAEEQFVKALKRHTKLLKAIIAVIGVFIVGAIAMALYSLRNTYPALVDQAVLYLQLSMVLFVTLLISNGLRVYFQRKIDQSNAERYGRKWSK